MLSSGLPWTWIIEDCIFLDEFFLDVLDERAH